MLHENSVSKAFLKKDHNSQDSSNKLNLYGNYHYQMAQKTQQEEQVLDLSRRCDSVETPPRKSPSPPQFSENNSPTTTTQCESILTASRLAVSIQKLYSSQHSTNVPILANTLLPNGAPLYPPMYYPMIKQERDLSPTPNDHTNLQPSPKISPIHSTANYTHSNLMKSNSYSHKNSTTFPNISPNRENEDRLSDINSIPGSPSSTSTSILHPKLMKSSSDIYNKSTRPFKEFPRDPLVLAANFAATDILYDNRRVEKYTEYRKRVLEQIRSANGGERTVTNPKMRRTNTRNTVSTFQNDGSNSDSLVISDTEEHAAESTSDNDSIAPSTTNNHQLNNNPNDLNSGNVVKDAAYYERRRKNNAAAKKSRDRRRMKEDEISIRAAYLERQNIELLCQLESLKKQLADITKLANLKDLNLI